MANWYKGLCLSLAFTLLIQGVIVGAPAAMSRPITSNIPISQQYTLQLQNLGMEEDRVVSGARSESVFWFPMHRVKIKPGSVVQMAVSPSPVVRGNGTFQFYVNERLVTVLTVDQVRNQPSVSLPIPVDAAGTKPLKVTIRPSLSITDDICKDDQTGNLFYIVKKESHLALQYEPLPPGSVGDFFLGVHQGFVVVLPDQPTLEEANAAIWVYGTLRRNLVQVPAVIAKAGELGAYAGWSKVFVETAGRGRVPSSSPSGIKMISNTELVVHGGDGEQLKSTARQLTEGIRLVSIPALEAQSTDLKKAAGMQHQDIIQLASASGSGIAEARVDIDVFSQLFSKPPETMTFKLDGTYSISAGRAPRLDLYFNGHLIESETLENTGHLTKIITLPSGVGILGRNKLTTSLVYPDNGGLCQYKAKPNMLELSGSSYMTGNGTFPLQQLQWQNVAVAFGQPGLVLISNKLEFESIRGAAEMVALMNRQLPAGLWTLPELASLENPPSLETTGYIILLGKADEVPSILREKLPIPVGENSLAISAVNGMKLGFQPSRDSVIGQITAYGKIPLIALTTFGGLSQFVPAIQHISMPRNFGLLEGNVLVYDSPSTMVVFDSRKLPSNLQGTYWQMQLNRLWSQYHIWILVSVWLAGMFFVAWVYRKQRGRIHGIIQDGKHSKRN